MEGDVEQQGSMIASALIGALLVLGAWRAKSAIASSLKESTAGVVDLTSDEEDTSETQAVADLPASAGSDDLPEYGYGERITGEVRQQISTDVVNYEREIRTASERFDVPSDLLAVTIHEESSGRTNAVGDDGASYGLGQIQKGAQQTVNSYFDTTLDRKNPFGNVLLTAGYLRYLKDEWYAWYSFQSLTYWWHPVRAYRCGLGGAKEDWKCSAQEAAQRLEKAGMRNHIPSTYPEQYS